MTFIDFHDPSINDDFHDIATMLCRYPGTQAPIIGTGTFPRVANTLLCPENACHAALVMLQAWGDPKEVVVKGDGAWIEDDDMVLHVRIDGTSYGIRARSIPTLFTLLLPLISIRVIRGGPLLPPEWKRAEYPWRQTARELGFKKLYPNEGKSFGLSDGNGRTLFVALCAPTAIHLANALTSDEFFKLAADDPHCRTTEFNTTGDVEEGRERLVR
jgi:hypothetical protein